MAASTHKKTTREFLEKERRKGNLEEQGEKGGEVRLDSGLVELGASLG